MGAQGNGDIRGNWEMGRIEENREYRENREIGNIENVGK